MELQGTIYRVFETKQVTEKFKRRELVLTTEENTDYPQQIMIEFTQDRCDLLNSAKIGDKLKVDINLRGRNWTNPEGEEKFFNSVQGWRIEFQGQQNDNLEFGSPQQDYSLPY